MDFIEKYLGFSPDHRDGSFEAVLLIMLVTMITGIATYFFAKPKTTTHAKQIANDRRVAIEVVTAEALCAGVVGTHLRLVVDIGT
jgi:hypothetical protein